MNRSIQAATLQMDVQPAPTDDRLFRADQMILDAVELGAELVVLPELFNTGYVYSDENFHRAENLDGPTVTWMKHTARRMQVHLAGSLLLCDGGDIFNAMFIVSPDGRTWRYDKSYPWGWEHGYFRANRAQNETRAVVAQTSLGDLGMLVCWDVAHPELWQHYAGRVDMMVVCSCPPQISNPTFCLPDGARLTVDQLGSSAQRMKDEGSQVFGAMVDEQAAWLGVPLVQSSACGQFESAVPNGRASLLALIPSAPSLARYLPQADRLTITTSMIDAARIVSAAGKPLARLPQSRGEGFLTIEVPLADEKPRPTAPQPVSRASRQAYFFSDSYLPRILKNGYQRGLGRA